MIDRSEDDDVADRLSKLEAGIEQVKAEIEWIKVVVGGKAPSTVPEKTSPPWLLILSGTITPVAVAIIATQPWK